ncbi:hypothetical protein LguiA_014575 [Lonicera macranthoides]
MAVEATNLSFYPSQLITNGDFTNSNQQQNVYMYNTQMGTGPMFTGTVPDNLLPLNQSPVCDSIPAKVCMKADSGVTYNLSASRKHLRDSMMTNFVTPQKNNLNEFSSFLGDEISHHIQQQQQLEIDNIIAHHTKRIRLEVQERQKQQERLIISAIGDGVAKKLNEKEEQIQRMGKLNLFLQEKVKTLLVENQLWRNMAQTNEATAISLRSNLEQVLAHVSEDRFAKPGAAVPAEADEAESCCGSTCEEEGAEVRTLAAGEDQCTLARMCRKCGEREACVLLLPCRHLCLCSVCGSSLMNSCPVCNISMDATVHVNMS